MSNTDGQGQHPVVLQASRAAKAGLIDRRELVALASAFGASASFAYGIVGKAAPAAAQAAPKSGGVLKVGMRVLDMKDPRTFDWTEMGNVARQFLDTLVRWEPDFTFSGGLLQSWEVSDDARVYQLNLRSGVRWNNGDPFTAEDVIFNFARWCDTSEPANSMAARLRPLIDDATGQLRDGAIDQIDDVTLRLNLSHPDITLIPGLSDYPALLVHPGFDPETGLTQSPVGTGPFTLESFEPGKRATLRRRATGAWWGGEVFLDGIDFIDYGTDPAAIFDAFAAGEIHLNDETSADYVDVMTSLGLEVKEKETANTIVARMRADTPPFDVQALRNAVQLAVNNDIVLELGLNRRGSVAENHHCGPMHPDYARLPQIRPDPARAKALLDESGHADTEFELISIDDGWRRYSTDAIGVQLQDAGFKVRRRLVPGATFWENWKQYPFSTTNWGGRPLGVQIYALAYRSGEAWNESGFANADFDAKLTQAIGTLDTVARQAIMAQLQKMLQDSGTIVQPFWMNIYCHHVPALQNYQRHQFREMHFEQVWLDL